MVTFLGIAAGLEELENKANRDLSGYFVAILFLQSVLIILYGMYKPDHIILWTNISPLICSVVLARFKLKYK
jgi:hypothetical protein